MKLKKITSEGYIYIFLLSFWIFSSSISGSFRSVENFSNILCRAVSLSLVSLGQTYVILTAGFDLSVGGVVCLSTVIASVTMGKSIVLGIALVVLAGTGIGFINGLGVARFKVNSFIMTFGTMVIAQGLALLIRDYPGGYIPSSYINSLLFQAGSVPLTPLVLFMGTFLGGELVLQKRNFGRLIYAVGGSEENARKAGINTILIKTSVYAISGLTASLGGLFLAAEIACGDPTVGGVYMFDSITAVVMGGTLLTGGRGNFKGTIAAVLIISSIGSILNMKGVDIWYQNVIKGLLLVTVVAARSIFLEKKKEVLPKDGRMVPEIVKR